MTEQQTARAAESAVERARQLLDDITPTPWRLNTITHRVYAATEDNPDEYVAFAPLDTDAELIAAAPTLIADLLADHDRLTDDLRKLSTRTTGDDRTDLRMLYAYEAGVMEAEARLADENRALRAAIDIEDDFTWSVSLSVLRELMVRCPSWGNDLTICEALLRRIEYAANAAAAADRGDTDGDRNEGDER